MKFLKISCLAVAMLLGSSSTAQAQNAMDCIAGSSPNTVRAEGITEVVGDIQVRCRQERGPHLGLPAMVPVVVELQNVNITNGISGARIVDLAPIAYGSRGIDLTGHQLVGFANGPAIADAEFGDGVLSSDGTSITWTLNTANAALLLGSGQDGFDLVISGVRINASRVTAGGNIFANVRVNNETINSNPLQVAQVATGLNVTVDAARGLQCEPTGNMAQTAIITIQEGFVDAITDDHSLEVTFTEVPGDVQVTVPNQVPLPGVNPGGAFTLDLVGAVGPPGTYNQVSLSSSGRGTVVYNIGAGTTDPLVNSETATLEVRFEWGARGAVPNLGQAMVRVSYNPTSSDLGDTSAGDMLPRFILNSPRAVLSIDECTTTMVFPFVTNQLGYETGIVFSNTSGQSGRCDMTVIGDGVSRTRRTEVIPSRSQKAFVLSSEFPGFQGQMEVECSFQNGDGYAYVLSPAGDANSGYLPRLRTN